MNSPALALKEARAGDSIRLNLGGRETRIPGFKNVDLQDLPTTDIRDDLGVLQSIATGSISEIYASHVLEHFMWDKTLDVLKAWRRVLKSGGIAYIAVPDWDVIVRIYRSDGLTQLLIELLYGEPHNKETFGIHYNVFNFSRLARFLMDTGFSDVERIPMMPYDVQDCSKILDNRFHQPISLMVKATA